MRRLLPLLPLALLALGCHGPASPPETVRIGIVMSLSGGLESFGTGAVNTAELAEQEVNAAGGVLPGRTVELVIADDQSQPTMGAAEAARVIDEEGVVAVIGSFASGVSLAVAEETYARQVPQISCCSTSDQLTTAQPETDRYFFRTVPPDGLQAQVLASAASADFGCTQLAVMHLDNAYGNPMGEAVEREFTGLGGEVVTRIAFEDGLASYTSEVATVQAEAPDCVALIGYPESGGRIVRDWYAAATPPDVTWIGADSMRIDAFIAEVSNPALTEGFKGTAPITVVSSPSYARFDSNYGATFGTSPEVFSGPQFDAIALALLAVAHAGSTDGAAIRDSLYEVARPPGVVFGPGELGDAIAVIRAGGDVNYEGAGGSVDLDEQGNVVAQYEIWEWTQADGFQTLRLALPEAP